MAKAQKDPGPAVPIQLLLLLLVSSSSQVIQMLEVVVHHSLFIWRQVFALEGPYSLKLSTWSPLQWKSSQQTRNFLQTSFMMMLCLFALHSIWKKLKKILCYKERYSLSVLQALSVIFTPVSVAWPLPFISSFESTSFKKPKSIELDVLEVIEHICAGRIELRDPNDLRYLFQDKLLVYGLKVKACIKTQWWLKTAMWTSTQFVHPFPTGSIEEAAYSSSFLTPENSLKSFIDLDFVSSTNLRNAILRIQLALQPESSIVVKFSCLSNKVGFLTSDFLLCAIPFLPYLSEEKKGRKKNRKETPLFISMQDIVSLFSTGRVKIQSVQNISLQHAAMLLCTAKDLVDNRNMRTAHIANVGLRGWREDRLMLVWEAGLLGSGLLTRWSIKITK